MATFTGNLSFKMSMELYSRIFVGPWVKKASSITCCKRYESSGPVRYIPKRYSKSKEAQSLSPKKNSEETEFDNCLDSASLKNDDSWRMPRLSKPLQNSVSFVDQSCDAEAVESSNVAANTDLFELENEYESVHEETFDEVEISCEHGPCEGHMKRTGNDKLEAERIAIEALATRAFTAFELQKKLRGKRFSLDLINEVITDLQRRGLVNDYLYAETFSQSRWSTSTWGPRRIKQALQRKGVTDADAERATKHVFQGIDHGGDTEQSFGMSKLSLDHLFAQASKQWLRGQNVPHEKRKSRIIRWLQYRGFNWGITSFILKKLETQYPP